MTKLILIRHGLSVWNEKNLFTGWVDIPLSQKGVQESISAGQKIAKIPIDRIFTSSLVRAHMTLVHVMLQHESQKIPLFLHPGQGRLEEWGQIYSESARHTTVPVIAAWQLNERMYGHLQGLNKAETAQEFGSEQVQIWRRSFDVAPPGGESLKMTAARAIPYFKTEIVPYLSHENVLICAHGNSLRAIIMDLEKLSPEQVVKLELATGEPVVYNYNQGRFARVTSPDKSV